MFNNQKFLTRGVMADIPSWLANLFKECLSTHTKNKILNTLARECQVRGTDATGIAYNFNDRLRIYKHPLPARRMKIFL